MKWYKVVMKNMEVLVWVEEESELRVCIWLEEKNKVLNVEFVVLKMSDCVFEKLVKIFCIWFDMRKDCLIIVR